MGRLFGTDGVRGIANLDLTCELATSIGRAAALVLTDNNQKKKPKVLIGKDPRISSSMLESALSAGLLSVGVNVELLGVVPTPAVPLLVKKYNADAGIMISASHNSFEYNGIKIFNHEGFKLSDEKEDKIESIIKDNIIPTSPKTGAEIGMLTYCTTAVEDYVNYLKDTVSSSFNGMRVAFDCANGSSSVTARKLFESVGVDGVYLNDKPDGININLNCGSTHIEVISDYVRRNNFDIGFAFDGDADRCLAVDENGDLIDGDKIIAICANYMKKKGLLKNNTVVATVMSNMGFFVSCKENDINVKTTKVGDRYVLEEMLEHGYSIGGEQSGHIIFLDYENTGDGQLTALMLLDIMKSTGKKLSELASIMDTYPQILINVKTSPEGKDKFNNDEEIKLAIQKAYMELGKDGRLLVRASGTEPLIRVMAEGKDAEKIEKVANEIANIIRERLV